MCVVDLPTVLSAPKKVVLDTPGGFEESWRIGCLW